MTISKSNLTFGEAIEALKKGEIVAREGWNGKNMYLILIKGEYLREQIAEQCDDPSIKPLEILDSIAMRTAQGQIVIGWLASQTDMLSEDWVILDWTVKEN